MHGFVGRILRLDLSNRKTSIISTTDYQQWGGGHGVAAAVFFDLVETPPKDAFDPANVLVLMTSPLTGTLAPATGRTEVVGVGAQPFPTQWFTRSNFGGRFGAMLKYAGFDGVVIEGKADSPVWVDIRNQEVRIKDARSLWGLDTWQTQAEVWKEVTGRDGLGDWNEYGGGERPARTTQKPAVLTIGQAGEKQSRIGCLIHDAGNAAGVGGFGGVWGSKNLKAISVIGTGSVSVAHPNDLMEARTWLLKNYSYNVDNPRAASPVDNFHLYGVLTGSPGYGPLGVPVSEPSRPQGCMSCPHPCRRRTKSSAGNGSMCFEANFYFAESPNKTLAASDLLQKSGLNALEVMYMHGYLRDLHKMGVLGQGKEIECDLPFDKYGKYEFVAALVDAVASRRGYGDDLALGVQRAAQKWGRMEKDLASGLLRYMAWGCWEHYDPRMEIEWGYGSILSDRDINEHGLNWEVFWMPAISGLLKQKPLISAEKLVEIMAEKMLPYQDPAMLDYSEDSIYGPGKVKMVAWHRHYSRFWKQSALYCDWVFPDFFNVNSPDMKGFTPFAEPKFYSAVTGLDISFEQGMELGRKIWNLDRSIWVLQGRHRDQEVFADWIYDEPVGKDYSGLGPYRLPMRQEGKWGFHSGVGRQLDRKKFEGWKSEFYKFEGWDPASGRPTAKTLKDLGLDKVAARLQRHNKLGDG